MAQQARREQQQQQRQEGARPSTRPMGRGSHGLDT